MNGFVANTPDAISAVQLVTVKHALKLESKGMQMTRGPKLRKPWAIKLGLKPGATYEVVIAEIEKRVAKLMEANPQGLLEPI